MFLAFPECTDVRFNDGGTGAAFNIAKVLIRNVLYFSLYASSTASSFPQCVTVCATYFPSLFCYIVIFVSFSGHQPLSPAVVPSGCV